MKRRARLWRPLLHTVADAAIFAVSRHEFGDARDRLRDAPRFVQRQMRPIIVEACAVQIVTVIDVRDRDAVGVTDDEAVLRLLDPPRPGKAADGVRIELDGIRTK